MKTLLFCTSYISDESAWHQRYERWLAHHRQIGLAIDAIVMIDDGSPFEPPRLPVFPAHRIGLDALPPEAMVRFGTRLGRAATLDFPGVWRSLLTSVSLAIHYGFDRVIYIESDALVLTDRLTEFLSARTSGWTALWCPQLEHAESAISVLCADAFHLLEQLASQGPYGFRGKSVELTLPFTSIEKKFIGGRYHQFKEQIPVDADYAAQNSPLDVTPATRPTSLTRLGTDRSSPFMPHSSALRDAASVSDSGIKAYQQGDFVAARAALERADLLSPERGMTTKFLGAARMQQGELHGAISAAAQSAQLNAADADAQNMAGAFSLQGHHLLDAIRYFRAALKLDPENSSVLSNLAHINWADPLVAAQYPDGIRGVELEVRQALVERLQLNRLTMRGAAQLLAFGVHFREGFDALVHLARALMADSNTDAQTLFVCGNALIVAGDHDGALAAYRRAATLAPESDRIRNAIGYASICRGGAHFTEGFRIANESWPKLNPAAFASRPERWGGAPSGTTRLLVYQEQGIGDALMCLRLLPLVRARSEQAMLWLHPELAGLVSDQAGLPLIKSQERPDAEHFGFDRVTSLFGLIDALEITADRIPAPLILKASRDAVARFAGRLAGSKNYRVGLCLFGNPNRSDDWARSAGANEIAALAQIKNVDWINLSIDARPERDTLARLLPGLVDLTVEMVDFEATAALITNLDLVVSIDSVVAHLAASLGKPVLLLSPSIADWRWRIGQKDSPWWPTVEIFQADKAGDFSSAIGLVAERIRLLALHH